MGTIGTAVAQAEAARMAWRRAMLDLQEQALMRMVEDGIERPAIEAAADVLAGSMDAADGAIHLAFLDALAVVGVTVDS